MDNNDTLGAVQSATCPPRLAQRQPKLAQRQPAQGINAAHCQKGPSTQESTVMVNPAARWDKNVALQLKRNQMQLLSLHPQNVALKRETPPRGIAMT